MLPNLKSLEFVGAGPPKSSRETKDKVLSSVISALRYVNMPALDELDLRFPIAHDFLQLFPNQLTALRIPIESVLRRLRHLGLHVTEWKSQQGQRYWRKAIPPENLAFPNETFAGNIFNLINAAENIQSLSISSTNSLNLDNALFPNSLRLTSLHLMGVSVSAETLLGLYTACTNSIKFIKLWLVELNAGTWSHVLLNISMIPTLIDFHADSCGYSLAGTSARLRPGLLPMPDDPLELETEDFRDFHALAILQHRVNANRVAVALPKISEYDFRVAKKQTLEYAMAAMGLENET